MKPCTLIVFVFLFLIAGCGSPRIAQRPDAEIDRNASAAKSAYADGAMESAAMFYQKALNRARLADQPREISRLAYNLAACRAQMQKYPEALELLDEAEFESALSGTGFPEAVLLRAEILRHLGRHSEAAAAAKFGLASLDNEKCGSARFQLQVFLAELACDQNDGRLALQELDKLDPQLLKSSDANVLAKATHARGRALLIEKRANEAAICFDNAAAFDQKGRRYPDMAVALQNAADAYVAAGQRPAAINRYYRAARSLFMCGEKTRAQESFDKARALAQESDDKQMLSALARLKSEIVCGSGSNPVPAKAQAE